MFGFLIGTACLIGLIKVLRGGCGPRWGHCGWSGYSGGRWGGRCGRWGWRGRAGRWLLRALSYRLDLTPAQEKVVASAIEDVQGTAMKARETAFGAWPDLAGALKGEQLDHEALKGVYAKHGAALEEVQRSLTVAFSRVHEALDARQRALLAELLESGFCGRPSGCGA